MAVKKVVNEISLITPAVDCVMAFTPLGGWSLDINASSIGIKG
jgi:hypothetical protein